MVALVVFSPSFCKTKQTKQKTQPYNVFLIFKEEKKEGKRKEGRKETKQGSEENTTVGTESSTQTDVLRKLHFRAIRLCARLEQWSCGQQVFLCNEGWGSRESELWKNQQRPTKQRSTGFPMFIAHLCPTCLPSAMSISKARRNSSCPCLFFFFFMYNCFACISVCMSVCTVCLTPDAKQKKVLAALELRLQMTVSFHVGAENRTQDPCKNS